MLSGNLVAGLAVDPVTGNVVISGQLDGSISFGLPQLTGKLNEFLAEFQY
jgi:hypothetical protein